MPDLLPFPVVFPFTLASTVPDGDVESARKLSDRLRYVSYYLSLLLGIPLDTPITGPVPLNVSLLGHRNQDSRFVDNNHMTLDADMVLTGAANSRIAIFTNPAAISVNINLAGPAVNGRDQAGSFPPNSFVHYYWMYNGTTLAGISSLTPPPGSPTLPAGYILGAYAGAALLDGASHHIAFNIRGRWTYYKAPINVLAAGTATVDTAISCSTAVPSNAQRIRALAQLSCTAAPGGQTTQRATFKDNLDDVIATVAIGSNAGLQGVGDGVIEAPNYGQVIKYALSTATGTPNLKVDVAGFENANAG